MSLYTRGETTPYIMVVSVVIPTYNRAEMLRATLGSVLAQTMLPAEIVVVDDGSTDATPDVVAELDGAEGVPITLLRGAHRNRLGEARNRGVAATAGEVVAFLDSDDLWQPRRVERQLEAWGRQPRAGFAFCNVQRFDERGPLPEGPYLDPSVDYNGSILGYLLEEPVAVPGALMVKREAFLRFGGFGDRSINEDYELLLKLAAYYPASYVPEPLVLLRKHEGSRSRALAERAMLEYLKIVKGFLADHPQLPRQTRWRGRHGMANVHYKLARLYAEAGERTQARRHLRALLKLRPWDRRALALILNLKNAKQNRL